MRFVSKCDTHVSGPRIVKVYFAFISFRIFIKLFNFCMTFLRFLCFLAFISFLGFVLVLPTQNKISNVIHG